MKVSWWHRPILPAMYETLGNSERVKAFQVQLVQVDLCGLWCELLPHQPSMLLDRVLHEIVAPGFPWSRSEGLRCFVRSHCRRMTAILRLQRLQKHIRQQIEDTLIVLEDKGIQENGPCDSAWKPFHDLLNDCAAKTVPHQDDAFQLVFLNVSDNRSHTISMCNADTCRPWAMAGERGRVCTMPLSGKVSNDVFPCPSAVPRSVNQNKRFIHSAFLLPSLIRNIQAVSCHLGEPLRAVPVYEMPSSSVAGYVTSLQEQDF